MFLLFYYQDLLLKSSKELLLPCIFHEFTCYRRKNHGSSLQTKWCWSLLHLQMFLDLFLTLVSGSFWPGARLQTKKTEFSAVVKSGGKFKLQDITASSFQSLSELYNALPSLTHGHVVFYIFVVWGLSYWSSRGNFLSPL